MTTLKLAVITLSLLTYSLTVFAETTVKFVPMYDGLNDVQITKFTFYISNLQLLNNGVVVFEDNEKYHLLNTDIPESMSVTLDSPKDLAYTEVRYVLGIDSATNSAGVKGGCLDPIHGMYWTWQSGYIHVKLEGTCKEQNDNKGEFQFHVGGYMPPYSTIHVHTFLCKPNEPIQIDILLDNLFATINVDVLHHVMSPNANNAHISAIISSIFKKHQ